MRAARTAATWAALAAVAGAAARDDPSLPDGPEKALVVRVCTACHEAATFTQLRLSREEWTHEVDGMIERGAKANRREAKQIVDYLVKHFRAGKG